MMLKNCEVVGTVLGIYETNKKYNDKEFVKLSFLSMGAKERYDFLVEKEKFKQLDKGQIVKLSFNLTLKGSKETGYKTSLFVNTYKVLEFK